VRVVFVQPKTLCRGSLVVGPRKSHLLRDSGSQKQPPRGVLLAKRKYDWSRGFLDCVLADATASRAKRLFPRVPVWAQDRRLPVRSYEKTCGYPKRLVERNVRLSTRSYLIINNSPKSGFNAQSAVNVYEQRFLAETSRASDRHPHLRKNTLPGHDETAP